MRFLAVPLPSQCLDDVRLRMSADTGQEAVAVTAATPSRVTAVTVAERTLSGRPSSSSGASSVGPASTAGPLLDPSPLPVHWQSELAALPGEGPLCWQSEGAALLVEVLSSPNCLSTPSASCMRCKAG